jgi:hypothetical protein
MKKLFLLSAAILASGLSLAQEVGRVISSTPIVNSAQSGNTAEQVVYNVVYELGGKQYTVQMPNDPGPSVQLQVSPVGAVAQTVQPSSVQPVYSQPSYVVVAPPAYYGYYTPNYVVPFALGLGFGYLGGYGGHGHGGWGYGHGYRR